MSLVSTIEIDVKKFLTATGTDAEKFAAAFSKIFGKAPAVIQTIENFVNEAAPLITAAVTIADPIAEPEVAGALTIAETALAAIQVSATAAVSGQSLLVNLQNFANTVPTLLTGIAIKNPALQAAILRIVNLVTGEAKVLIPAVETWVAQIAAATPPATTA